VEPQKALPYEPAELAETQQRLQGLGDASVRNLMAVDAPPQSGVGQRLTSDTFQQLFDTHPLPQGDIDITPYLRVGDMRDVSVLWRQQLGPDMPPASDQELCPVPLRAAATRFQVVWTPRGDGWAEIPSTQLVVGDVAAVACSAGGYDRELGWSPTSTLPVAEVAIQVSQGEAEDRSSFRSSVAVTLPQHLSDAQEEATSLCQELNLPAHLAEQVIRSAWLHDIGKAHPVFQATMRANGCGAGQWAKAPGWGSRHGRAGFRHEVASALAALKLQEHDLVAYLLMAHHGKVRQRLEPFPWQSSSDPLHGVVAGEELPAVIGVTPATSLPFPPTGLGKGWRPLSGRLLRSHGPFQLALLEAVVREADARASRRWQVPGTSPPCT
jgi:CRISPR-associated endonuclease/helicase Cas3